MKTIIENVKAEMLRIMELVKTNKATEPEKIRLTVLTEFVQNLKRCDETWPGVL